MKATVRAQILAVATALAAVAPIAASPASASPPAQHLLAAGDLDRDGRRDLLAERFTPSANPLIPGETTFAGVRGITGKDLWSFTESGEGLPIPAHVGYPVRSGAILQWTTPVGPLMRTHVLVVNGSGEAVWERTSYGAENVGGATGIIYGTTVADAGSTPAHIAAVIDANGDRAEDVLLQSITYLQDGALARYEMISGIDGVAISDTTVQTSYPTGTVGIRDISGDGRDDYFLIASSEATPGVSARRGYDGAELWSAPIRICNAGSTDRCSETMVDLGDVSGDRKRDFAFSSPVDGSTIVLSGGDGKILWTRGGSNIAYRLGDMNGDGKGDIGLQSEIRTRRSLAVLYEAIDGRGRILSARTYKEPLPARCPPSKCTYAVDRTGPLGDLNRDGLVDAAHYFYRYVPNGTLRPGTRFLQGAVVSGRQRPLWQTRTQRFTLHAMLWIPIGIEKRMYLLSILPSPGRIGLLAQVPRTGRTVWVGSFPIRKYEYVYDFHTAAPPVKPIPLVPSVDLNGDGTPDFVINLSNSMSRLLRSVTVDGATGRVIR